MSTCCSKRTNSLINIDSKITFCDKWDYLKYRLGIKRDSYLVTPGIYKLGNPQKESLVFVSCNLKFSFNQLRNSLKNKDAWILVIDTKGINVWCAAGKGTFGTNELIEKIEKFKLKDMVSHQKIILPQLGAHGVNAIEVKEKTGFKILWGPVRANDLLDYIDNGLSKTRKMMQVDFNLLDRLAVVPLEMVRALKYTLIFSIILLIASGLSVSGISFQEIIHNGFPIAFSLVLAWLTGNLFAPILLPYIPLRSFAAKGFLLGLIIIFLFNLLILKLSMVSLLFWSIILMNSAFSAFWTLNFTGCSTFTSPSGVERELRLYLRPIYIIFALGFIVTTFLLCVR